MKFVVTYTFLALLQVFGGATADPLDNLRGGSGAREENEINGDKESYSKMTDLFRDNTEITHEHVRKLLFHEEEVDVIVVYRNAKGARKIRRKAKKKGKKIDVESQRSKFIAISASPGDIANFLDDPDIERVEIDYEMKALPNASIRGESDAQGQRRLAQTTPYGITMVQAQNPTLGPNAANITVCIIDTGYGLGHPDLPVSKVNGFSPYDSDRELWDVDGDSHGTHCAGTIAALGNSIGVVGVIPDADTPNSISLYIAKGLKNSGSGSYSGIAASVDRCVEVGAKVVSMSLGGSSPSEILESACINAEANGALVVAAAGNDGDSTSLYPAYYGSVMAVAAVDSSERRASFSQQNDQVEISGPGVGVQSTITFKRGQTIKFDYGFKSGTSMATPHVAGVATLLWSYDITCTPRQIRGILVKTAKDLGATGCEFQYGHGLVQAQAAIDLLQQQGCKAGDDYATGAGCNMGPTEEATTASTATVTMAVPGSSTTTPEPVTTTPVPEATSTSTLAVTMTPVPSGWTQLLFDDFESGWISFISGGNDASLVASSTHAKSGVYSALIRDDSSTSMITTGTLDVSSYSKVNVIFWYELVGMETGEGFSLQFSNDSGTSWTIVETWARGADFQNGNFYSADVVFSPTSMGKSFTSTSKIRFHCQGSNNNDRTYIDDVEVKGFEPPP